MHKKGATKNVTFYSKLLLSCHFFALPLTKRGKRVKLYVSLYLGMKIDILLQHNQFEIYFSKKKRSQNNIYLIKTNTINYYQDDFNFNKIIILFRVTLGKRKTLEYSWDTFYMDAVCMYTKPLNVVGSSELIVECYILYYTMMH